MPIINNYDLILKLENHIFLDLFLFNSSEQYKSIYGLLKFDLINLQKCVLARVCQNKNKTVNSVRECY